MHILRSRLVKYNTLIFLLSVFSICFLNAQNATFKWSEWTKHDKEGLVNPNIVFPSETGFATYSIEKQGTQFYAPEKAYITTFDSNLETQSTSEVIFPENKGKQATVLEVLEGNNKLYFFSHLAIKKNKKNTLYVQVYDHKSHSVSEPFPLINIPIEKVNNSGFFQIELSPDKKTIAIFVNMPFEKKTKERIQVLTYNESLEGITDSEYTLSFDSKRAYTERIFVNDLGEVFIVKHTDISKKNPITSVITIGKSIDEQTISSDKFYTSDSKVITIDNVNYLIGFATDNAKPSISMGGKKDKSFFIHDLTNKKLIKNEGWSKDILKKVLGKGFTDISVKDILVDNEDIYLIGDCLTTKSEPIEGANFEYTYTHDFGPGIVVKLNAKGEIFYQQYLKYGENYKNDNKRIGSFTTFLKDGKLMILANEKESVLKEKKIVFGHRKVNARIPVLRVLDDKGELSTTPFWDSKIGGEDLIIDFAPTYSRAIEDNKFFIYAYGIKYHAFGLLNLE